VATHYGGNILSFKRAIIFTSIATFFGCLGALFAAKSIVVAFSGKGLVPDALVGSPHFTLSVIFGAALTILFATTFGFPVSTTHALVGGIAGAGFAAIGEAIKISSLLSAFVTPLLLSPIVAMFATALL